MEAGVDRNFFQWVMGAIGAVVSFIMGLQIRDSQRVNKLSMLIAAEIEGNKNRDKQIAKIESKLDELLGAITKWREENNELKTRINQLLDELK